MTPVRPPGSPAMLWLNSSPWRFHWRAALLPSHGVPSSWSCLAATGLMTSLANLRQRCWNSTCSSLSLKSTLGSPFQDAIDWSVNLSEGYVTHRIGALVPRNARETRPAVRKRWLSCLGVPRGKDLIARAALVAAASAALAGCSLGNDS